MPDSTELLTVPEVSKALRVKVSTIRAWVYRRQIRFHKLGGKVLFRRADLERLIAQGAVEPIHKGGKQQ